jgi:hypothetical protein
MITRELSNSAKENRRKAFQVYLRKVLIHQMTKENYYLIITFLELPLQIYKEWYIHCEMLNELKSKIKINQIDDFIGEALHNSKSIKLLSGIVDEG